MTILEKDTDAWNISFIMIPVEHLNILVGVLVELSDAAVDVLWDTVLAGMKDGHFVKIDHWIAESYKDDSQSADPRVCRFDRSEVAKDLSGQSISSDRNSRHD